MAKVKKKTKKKSAFVGNITLTRRNFAIFGIGILAIIIGYIVMATGETYSVQSLVIAPILLLIGYLIIVPISILYRKKGANQTSQKEED
jgi:membrane protein YdbS with pleckstrin-like domain